MLGLRRRNDRGELLVAAGTGREMSGGSWVPAVVGFWWAAYFCGWWILRCRTCTCMRRTQRDDAAVEAEHSAGDGHHAAQYSGRVGGGVAFGAAAIGESTYSVAGAIALTIGIGIQNLPEGLAVAMPLQRSGLTRWKGFMYGQFSGMVEPLAGVLGAVASFMPSPFCLIRSPLRPGAMIFVVVEDAIPEAQRSGNNDIATLGAMVGFALMMTLDVALG